MKKARTSSPARLHAKVPAFLTPYQAQLLLEGIGKLGWMTSEVRAIAPAIDELERVAAIAPPPAPPATPAPPAAAAAPPG